MRPGPSNHWFEAQMKQLSPLESNMWYCTVFSGNVEFFRNVLNMSYASTNATRNLHSFAVRPRLTAYSTSLSASLSKKCPVSLADQTPRDLGVIVT